MVSPYASRVWSMYCRQRIVEAFQVFLTDFDGAHVVQMAFVTVEGDAVEHGLAALFIAQYLARVGPDDVRVCFLGGRLETIKVGQLRFHFLGTHAAIVHVFQQAFCISR